MTPGKFINSQNGCFVTNRFRILTLLLLKHYSYSTFFYRSWPQPVLTDCLEILTQCWILIHNCFCLKSFSSIIKIRKFLNSSLPIILMYCFIDRDPRDIFQQSKQMSHHDCFEFLTHFIWKQVFINKMALDFLVVKLNVFSLVALKYWHNIALEYISELVIKLSYQSWQ